MPIRLNWPERQIFLNRNWGPGPILDLFGALAFQAVHAAVKLGVFETLQSRGPLNAIELKDALNADEFGMRLLLDALCGLGYLRRAGKRRYANTAMTRAWMLDSGSADLRGMLGYFEDAFQRWTNLDETIHRGRPAERADKWLDRHPGSWERYHANMRCAAELIGPQIVARARLNGRPRRLIDLGGSHGLYAVRFCERYAGLSAVVFDQKTARSMAQQTIAGHGMSDRITFTEGDLLTDGIGTGYDLVLAINLIRIFTREDALAILKKTFDAMEKGATILVADQFHTSMTSPFAQANALLIMLELYNSGVGRIHTAAEAIEMLAHTGFADPREVGLPRSPGIGMIVARRP